MRHRYSYYHKGKKHICPNCGERTYRTYWDSKLQCEAPHKYGACDRIHNCGVINYPPNELNMEERAPAPPPKVKRTDFRCPPEIVVMTGDHRGNVFAHWLVGLLGDKAKEALRAYRVGTYPTSDKRPALSGAMVFWQIGHDGLHRSGKIIPYGPDGKRIKERGAVWVHSIVYGKSSEELGFAQVLFGSHLLKERPNAKVCIVESEKTAIIASCFYPEYVWLATGGSHNLNAELCMCLVGSDVTLFPDTGMFQEWSNKAVSIGLDVMCDKFRVDDTLEAMGAEVGSDIADYLVPVRTLPDLFVIEQKDYDKTELSLALRCVDPLPEGHKRPPFDWDAPDKPAKHSDQSPIERVFSTPGMTALKGVFDIDMGSVTIKPLE